ncbi:MAG: TraR/DksA C4-type zinc finger protein [Desulfobacterales bacterium]|nr:TraR/DksA C4-type zinc finger protein [Desulfobacterales bacterium]
MSSVSHAGQNQDINQFADIKQNLLNRKRDLWNQIREDLEKEAMEKHQEIANIIKENGDIALEELREADTFSLIGLKVEELEEIDQALNRIEIGQYGRCIDCGRWIDKKRLEIMPYAVRCRDCQERHEEIQNAS